MTAKKLPVPQIDCRSIESTTSQGCSTKLPLHSNSGLQLEAASAQLLNTCSESTPSWSSPDPFSQSNAVSDEQLTLR